MAMQQQRVVSAAAPGAPMPALGAPMPATVRPMSQPQPVPAQPYPSMRSASQPMQSFTSVQGARVTTAAQPLPQPVSPTLSQPVSQTLPQPGSQPVVYSQPRPAVPSGVATSPTAATASYSQFTYPASARAPTASPATYTSTSYVAMPPGGSYVTSAGVLQHQPQSMIRTVPQQIVRSTAQVVPTSQQNVLSGPGLTQGAYETKHKDDPQLKNLKELRKTSGLKEVPVDEGLAAMKQAGGEDGKLGREQFLKAYEGILAAHKIAVPSDATKNAVFDLFDRDDNGVVDLMELICGISLLCAGSEDDKIHAVFNTFDQNGDGYISMDEMYKFLTSVFKVVLTPNVMGVMNSMGVSVESAEDLASVTALECFKTADLNQDGKLSVTEFKNWFYAPRNDPSFLFSPVRKLLS